MPKTLKCGSCGAMVNIETGETYLPQQSNAESIEQLKLDLAESKQENEDLKNELEEKAARVEEPKEPKGFDPLDH